MARESQLWQTLNKARFELREMLHMHRVENSASPGSPDVEGFLEGMGAFQYELKSTERPANPATPIRFDMRDKQIEYARRRWAIGGAIFWLLQVGEGGDRRIYMLEGDQGAAIDGGLPEAELAARDILQAKKFDAAECVKMAFR